MFPHSILEKFALKLSALEKQSNIQDLKTSPKTNSNGQFLCIEKQRQMISHCLLSNKDESDIKQIGSKSLSIASSSIKNIQINEEESLQEGEIPPPPKPKINTLSQDLKYRVRKTWAKPNVQSYQRAEKIQLETREEKVEKETKEVKQQKRKSILDSHEDREKKSWAKPYQSTDEKGEMETKYIKKTDHQKQQISSHKSTIHLNSEDSPIPIQQHQIMQEDQQLIVKSLKKVCLNQNNLPYVYMMDNLVQMYLCNRVPRQLIKIYIKQLSSKYEMPYNKILIFFGIEALIAKFCTSHDIYSQFLDNYLCSELEMMLPQLINRVRISNWYVIQRIALGVAKRLGIKKEITDHWLLTILNKSKKFLREGKVDVEKIFRVAKSRELSQLNLSEEPTQSQLNEINYFGDNMKLFLRRNEQILQLIQFRDTDEQQVIETSQREGLSNKLTYFKKIELKAKQNEILRQKQKQKQKLAKKNKKNKKFEDQNILSNQADNFFTSNFQVQVNQQELHSDISIISEQSFQKSNSDNFFVQAYDQDQDIQERRGKKQKKVKQKKIEKEISKQRYSLRRGLREESELIQKHQTSKESKQIQKSKAKPKKLQIKQANKKKSKSMKSLQSINKDDKLKNAISWLEQNQISDSPIKVGCNLLEKLEKTKKCGKKINKMEIDEQGLMKMDQILFQFFQRKPSLTMQMIKQEISRVLKEEMDIPLKLHRRISDKWLERFRETKIG